MANTKKTTTEENTEKEVVETKKQDSNEIDIEAIIAKAVAATSEKYESKISEYEAKIKDLESKNEFAKFSPNRRVKLMHMGAGSANFSRGRIHVDFKNLFDVVDIRYDIFEDMYDEFRNWFTNFEIVILDKDIREDKGIEREYIFKGADKDEFYEMLTMNNDKMLAKLNNLSYVVAMAFLKFFIDEYLNHNADTLSKFEDVKHFYSTNYGIDEIETAIQEVLK